VAYEDYKVVEKILAEALYRSGVQGVAAVADELVVGFTLAAMKVTPEGSPESPFLPPRAAFVDYGWHAIASDQSSELYRDMYATLAPVWVSAGCLDHIIVVPTSDASVIDAWFTLGFGKRMAVGTRNTDPIPAHRLPEDITVRRASTTDWEILNQLLGALPRHLAGSPSYFPCTDETVENIASLHRVAVDRQSSRYWLAWLENCAVGVTISPELATSPPMDTPIEACNMDVTFVREEARGRGVGLALLDTVCRWAEGNGQQYLYGSWEPANLSADRFWKKEGWHASSYWLSRHIDERCLTANAHS
jgi:GNAT superfamily N-acetyltransferase